MQPYNIKWVPSDVVDSVAVSTDRHVNRDFSPAHDIVHLVPKNIIFQSLVFGLAVVITYLALTLNDVVDSAATLDNDQAVKTLKYETSVVVLIAYIIMLLGVYNKST